MIEERDPLREAIEREVLLYCSCPGTCCCAATVNDVHAAVAPLLAAERERREEVERRLEEVTDHAISLLGSQFCERHSAWARSVDFRSFRAQILRDGCTRCAADAAMAASDGEEK